VAAGRVLIQVARDDIEADPERTQALGETILRLKTEIPGIGWWGLFRDPPGNAVALFTSLDSMPASG
jgi:predicted enzyme related to lactoylglutathione lyase